MNPHEGPEPQYGTDTTDEFATLAEATVQDDGTVHIDIVQVDLDAPGSDPVTEG